GDERGPAPGSVGEVPEDGAAEGAGDEADEHGAERGGLSDERGVPGEEEVGEDQSGGCPVDGEVVPLDGGAYRAGDCGTYAQKALGVGHGGLAGCVGGWGCASLVRRRCAACVWGGLVRAGGSSSAAGRLGVEALAAADVEHLACDVAARGRGEVEGS